MIWMVNLIKNDGFEEGQAYWWWSRGDIVSDEKYSGHYSVYNPDIQQYFHTDTYQIYYLRFRYKTIEYLSGIEAHAYGVKNEPKVYITQIGEEDYQVFAENMQVLHDKPLRNGWREFLGKFVGSGGRQELRLLTRTYEKSQWFDDVYLGTSPPAPPPRWADWFPRLYKLLKERGWVDNDSS